MSTAKHKSYRSILNIKNDYIMHGDIKVPVKVVIWCIINEKTSRTIKTNHIGISTYIGTSHGISAYMPRKYVSLNIKNPLNSKFFETVNLDHSKKDSLNMAYRHYITNKSRSIGLIGVVSWFSGDHGMIKCNISGNIYEIYACNIKGAKTWYPETACMFVKAGETVTFDLVDMGSHVTACKVRGNVYFDAEKWSKLDQSKLAFKCD